MEIGEAASSEKLKSGIRWDKGESVMLRVLIFIFVIGLVAAIMILSYMFANYILGDEDKKDGK